MHELSVCGAIYEIVDRTAAGRPVSVVHLHVGKLRQVVPDTLAFCWTVVCDDTPLEGSRLDVDYRPVTLRCRGCDADATISGQLLLMCPRCGGDDVAVTGGEELLVTALDLVEA